MMKRYAIYGAIALCGLAWNLYVCAQDDSPKVDFHCGFESDTWYKDWGYDKAPRQTETIGSDETLQFEPLHGNALKIGVEQGGHYGTSFAYRFREQLGSEPEEIYFRYYLRLADDWDAKRGGKFPGFGGTYGRAGWGGRPVSGTEGWSSRGLFLGLANGKTPVGFYCYHADMKGKYGSNFVWDQNGFDGLERNRWYCIEQYARMNTPSKHDGILRAWVDGTLVYEKTDLRMRDVDSLKIETVWMNVYLGGTWSAESEHHLYIDEVAISNEPIGLFEP